MISWKGAQGSVHTALEVVGGIVERRHSLPILAGRLITNGFPESGGGGGSAADEVTIVADSNDSPVASDDDDDGGDDDADPDRRRLIKHPSPSGKHRTASAAAGALPSSISSDISLWRLPTVLQHVPISRSGWWAGVKAGRYPAPVRLSTRCVAWKSEDIRALINSL